MVRNRNLVMLVRRERLIALAVALVLGCGAFVYGLRQLELLMTFRPDRMTAAERTLTPAGAESVWFSAPDGTRLHGGSSRVNHGPRWPQ
jgi:hypothetical protein